MQQRLAEAPITENVAAWVPPLARVGYAAKGIVYLLVGGVAIRAAFATGNAQGTSDSLAMLAASNPGRILLFLVAAGLAAHVIWRLVQALLDPEHREGGARRIAMRSFYLVSAGTYGSLAATAWQLGKGNATREDGHEVWIAQLLQQPMGPVIVMLVGAAVMGYGVHQVIKAARGDVNRHMRPPDADTRRGLDLIGRIGTAARGVVLLPIGWFVFNAARLYRASEAADTGEVLRMLGSDLLLAAVGVGLAAYGLHQVSKALFRRVRPPA